MRLPDDWPLGNLADFVLMVVVLIIAVAAFVGLLQP